MTKTVFFDSCMFIEYSKQNSKAVNIWQNLDTQDIRVVINPIVVDEVTYIMQKHGNIPIENIERKLFTLDILPIDKEVCIQTFQCIKTYNLKTHDAFILASCIIYGISYLCRLINTLYIPANKNLLRLLMLSLQCSVLFSLFSPDVSGDPLQFVQSRWVGRDFAVWPSTLQLFSFSAFSPF